MTEMTEIPGDLESLHELASRPGRAALESLAKCPGDIMVLGAGGKMGLHLCLMLRRTLDALGRQADTVHAVSRWSDPASRVPFEKPGIEIIAADLTDATDRDALPDDPNIFFLAGVKFGTSDSPELLHLMNVEMPASLLPKIHKARIVALSTGCVYSFSTPESGGSTEADPTSPIGDYAQSCLGREHAFTAGARDLGARVSLIRLNYSVDLQYGVLVDIAQKVRAGKAVDVSTGYANVIWQGDAINHIIGALEHASDSPPFIVNVTGERILKVREVAEAFGKRFHKEAILTGEETPTAWLSNATKAHRLFGAPAIDENQLMEMVAAWLETGGHTLDKPTHFETRDGKY